MRNSLIALASLFILSNGVVVYGQSNDDRISEIESQITELQSELKELTKDDKSVDGEPLGLVEFDGGSILFKEAYIYEDDMSPGGKSVLFIMDYTNKSDKPYQPSSAMIWQVDAKQESDTQVFNLTNNYNYIFDRYKIDSYKNSNIDLKPGATIEFEFSYGLNFSDSELTLLDDEGEIILTLDPNGLEVLSNN